MGTVDESQMPGQEQMPFAKLSPAEARERIQRYLSSRKSTLWGGAFDLSNAESRDEAEEFFLTALQDMDIVERYQGL